MLNAPKQSLEHDSKPSPTISRATYVVREHTRLTAGAPAPRGSSINEMRSPTPGLPYFMSQAAAGVDADILRDDTYLRGKLRDLSYFNFAILT